MTAGGEASIGLVVVLPFCFGLLDQWRVVVLVVVLVDSCSCTEAPCRSAPSV